MENHEEREAWQQRKQGRSGFNGTDKETAAGTGNSLPVGERFPWRHTHPSLPLLLIQACIMAVGGSRDVTVMEGGQLAVKSMMTVTLSADHRVYDGEIASAFLAAFKSNMEAPFKLLL